MYEYDEYDIDTIHISLGCYLFSFFENACDCMIYRAQIGTESVTIEKISKILMF